MKSLAIYIRGSVQGVWFRKYTKDEAQRLGLSGFVRNEPDGSVYAEVTGPEEKLDHFLIWCHKGSPASRVDKVEWSESDSGHSGLFRIRG